MDNTAQSAYMACPREFLFGMVLHRRSKERKSALSFGSLWHRILEEHYRSGADIIAVEEAATNIWEGDTPGDHRTLNRALMDYQKYLKTWGLAKDVQETVGFPDNPMVEMSTSAASEEIDHPYAGKIDRMVNEVDGLAFVEDHKTTSRLDKYYFDQFTNSNQMKGYKFLGGKLAPSIPLVGVRINVIHTLKNETNFHRRLITYSPSQMTEWADNYNKWIVRIRLDYWAWAIQGGADPEQVGIDGSMVDFLKQWQAFPAHFGDNGCSRKFGLCTYHGVCSLPPRVQMKALENDFVIAPWNPLNVEDDAE